MQGGSGIPALFACELDVVAFGAGPFVELADRCRDGEVGDPGEKVGLLGASQVARHAAGAAAKGGRALGRFAIAPSFVPPPDAERG